MVLGGIVATPSLFTSGSPLTAISAMRRSYPLGVRPLSLYSLMPMYPVRRLSAMSLSERIPMPFASQGR